MELEKLGMIHLVASVEYERTAIKYLEGISPLALYFGLSRTQSCGARFRDSLSGWIPGNSWFRRMNGTLRK
jgi:hypothetical protein